MTDLLTTIKEVKQLVREKHGSHNQQDHTPHKYRGGGDASDIQVDVKPGITTLTSSKTKRKATIEPADEGGYNLTKWSGVGMVVGLRK